MSERNGKCVFIPDGYTRDGFIESTKFHGDMRFVYRPTTVTERAVINGGIRFEYAKGTEQGFVASEKKAADALASHMVSWDVTAPNGDEVKLTADNALRIEPHLFIRLYEIIMGESLSDELQEQESEKNLQPG